MNFYLKVFLIFILAEVSVNGQSTDGKSSFTKEGLQRHLNYLGSDLFEGRGTGSRGGELTAKYLAGEFDKMKLVPAGNNGTYYQYIPMHGSFPKESSQMVLYANGKKIRLKLWNDYLLHSSGDQTFTPNPIPLVFAGYGITAPEYDYNDYQTINAENKIVVVLAGEPKSKEPDYFDGTTPTIYSTTEAKRRIAAAHGARGMIEIPNLIDDPDFSWQKKIGTYSFEYITLAYAITSSLSFILNPDTAEKLFINSGYNLTGIFELHKQNKMVSFPLETKISFKGEFKRRDFVTPNIIGMIEGSDAELKDSYVIVSAHYDHLGIGPAVAGDSVYNGVYDNAIGVAALLEIAGAFVNSDSLPKRSIIFLLLTGEEHGLLGSVYYTDHPVVPLYKTVADVNIDGIASFDNFNSIIGVGRQYSTLDKFMKETAEQNGLYLAEIPSFFKKAESFSKSDQITFADAGIPSILTMDGLDYKNISPEKGIEMFMEFSQKYYHTPFDDLSLPVNFDAAIQHIDFIYDLINNIADSGVPPKWKDNSPFLNARLRSIAEKR